MPLTARRDAATSSFRAIRWTSLSAHTKTRVLPSSIPGLQYVQDRVCANKYFALQHIASGKTVAQWRRGPVKARDVEFVSAVDDALRSLPIDWRRSESALGIDEATGVDIRNRTSAVATFERGEYRLRERA